MRRFKRILENRDTEIDEKEKVFTGRVEKISRLVTIISKIDLDDDLYQEFLSLLITSLVTQIEVYFKDLFIFITNNKTGDISNLLKKTTKNKHFNTKFKLEELGIVFENKISLGELIAECYNFQDLDSINAAYSNLYNSKFLDDVDKFIISVFPDSKTKYPTIPTLKEMIKLRHKIVHRGKISKDLSSFDIWIYLTVIERLFGQLPNMILEKYTKNKRKYKKSNKKLIL